MLHPHLLYEVALLRQQEFLQEAARARLAHEALNTNLHPASPNVSCLARATRGIADHLRRMLPRRTGEYGLGPIVRS